MVDDFSNILSKGMEGSVKPNQQTHFWQEYQENGVIS